MNNAWENAALIVIDVQIGLFQRKTPIYKDQELLENINRLENYAHSTNVPIIYIQHVNTSTLKENSAEWQLHPQLGKLDEDLLIHKRHPDAFKETTLEKELVTMNVRKLVVVGTLTDNCVKSTCIGAKKLGYEVVLVKDGHSTFGEKPANTINKWNIRLAEFEVTLKPTSELLTGER
ncbi:MAG: isochorismatase family protein [Candidatus Hodarchaeales archaeon]|jgi:nicotinamidase-related amidase